MRSRGRPRRHDDRGAVTVIAVAMLGMLVLLAGGLSVAEALVAGHRRAQSAADLAALAAAQAMQRTDDGCAAAAAIARANRASLDTCEVDGQDVLVTVRVTGPRWLGAHGDLAGQARAGPDR